MKNTFWLSPLSSVSTFPELEFINDILKTVETSVVDLFTSFGSGSADPKFWFTDPDPGGHAN